MRVCVWFVLFFVFCMVWVSPVRAACDYLLNDSWAIYRFDADSAQPYDYSGNNRNGSRYGTVTFNSSEGVLGGSFNFQNGRVETPAFDHSQNFCMAAWWRTDSVALNDQHIFAGGSAPGDYEYQAYLSSPAHQMRWWDGSSSVGGVDISPNNKQWYFYVGCSDQTSRYMWLNGSAYMNMSSSCDMNQEIEIGEFYNGGAAGNYFSGHLDMVMIFTKNLSASDVANLWNDGDGCDPSVPGVGFVNWGGYVPLNDSRFNEPVFYFNQSVLGGANCSLWEGVSEDIVPVYPDNLSGYWDFEEGSGNIAIDVSLYGNNGTVFNGSHNVSVPGNNSGFYSMGFGNDGVIRTERVDDDYSGLSWTACAWIYADDASPPADRVFLARHNATNRKNWKMGIDSSGNIFFSTYSTCSSGSTDLSSSGSISAQTWVHACFVLEHGVNKTIYVNGQWDAFSTSVASVPAGCGNQDVSIGRNVVNPALGWDGFIDEVFIYRRVLSADEIKYVYDYGVNMTKPGTNLSFVNVMNKSGVADGVKDYFNYSGMSDGEAVMYVGCDGTNSSFKYLVFDSTAPNPIFSVANNSQFYNETEDFGLEWLWLNVTASDETGDLYDLEVNLSDEHGNVWYSYTNGSLNYSFSWLKNLSINKTGVYRWYAKTCDSASIDLLRGGFVPRVIVMRDRVVVDNIEIRNIDGSVVGMDAEVQRFGVAFGSRYSVGETEEAYVVKSECPIHYLADSRHSGHLVSKECGQSVEFEPYEDVRVKRLSPFEFRVDIVHKEPVLVSKTQSVHYLNCQNSTVWFSVVGRSRDGILRCLYNSEPYLQQDIRMLCYFNESGSYGYECLSYTHKNGSIIRSNPEPEFVEAVGMVTTFSSQDRSVNVFFDTEHLRENISVDLVVECSTNETFRNFSVSVVPKYKDPYLVIDYLEYARINLPVLVGLFLSVLLIGIGAVWLWDLATKGH